MGTNGMAAKVTLAMNFNGNRGAPSPSPGPPAPAPAPPVQVCLAPPHRFRAKRTNSNVSRTFIWKPRPGSGIAVLYVLYSLDSGRLCPRGASARILE